MQKNNVLTYILLVLTAVFWGGSFVLTKEIFLSAPSITPSIIVTLRLVVATIVFVPFLLIAKKWQRIERRDIKYFFLLAFLEPFTYFLCENISRYKNFKARVTIVTPFIYKVISFII